MPIPEAITAEHVAQALSALDRGEPHPFGEPTGYELHYNGRRYAPLGGDVSYVSARTC
jgi:hypothetical protein